MRRHPVLMRAAVLGTTLAVVAVFAELAVRIAMPQESSWIPVFCKHPSLGIQWHEPGADVRVDTGECNWRILTNRDGYRVRDEAAAGTGLALRPSVLFLGDSFTFGYGVDFADSYAGLIEESLQGAAVVNAASGGYGPTQYRMILEHLLERGVVPGRVLVGVFLGNDYHDCVWDKSYRERRKDLRYYATRSSHLYRLASRTYHIATRTGPPELREYAADMYDEAGWGSDLLRRAEATFRTEFGRIRDLCAERGVPLRVVVIPTAESLRGTKLPGATRVANDLPAQRTLATLGTLGVPAFDAGAVLRPHIDEQIYFRHDGHLTARGHALVAAGVRLAWPGEFGK